MKSFSKHVWRLFFGLCLVCLLAVPGTAKTLHETSLQLLKQKLVEADPADYQFVVMGDSRDNDYVFGRILELAKSFKPLFILHDGDIVSKGKREEFEAFRAKIKSALPQTPFFTSIGNHELGKPKNSELFEFFIGPLDFSLHLPKFGLCLVALDNSRYAISENQLEYLAKELSEPEPLKFTLMHVPPQTSRWPTHTMREKVGELYSILKEKKVAAAFYGHAHFFDEATVEGVPSLITGGAGAPLTRVGIGDASYHIVLVRVKNGQASWREVRLEN